MLPLGFTFVIIAGPPYLLQSGQPRCLRAAHRIFFIIHHPGAFEQWERSDFAAFMDKFCYLFSSILANESLQSIHKVGTAGAYT